MNLFLEYGSILSLNKIELLHLVFGSEIDRPTEINVWLKSWAQFELNIRQAEI